MKKEITLNVLKYTLGLVLFFMVSSCSDEAIDVTTVLNDIDVNASSEKSSNPKSTSSLGDYNVACVVSTDGTLWTYTITKAKTSAKNLSHFIIDLNNCGAESATFANILWATTNGAPANLTPTEGSGTGCSPQTTTSNFVKVNFSGENPITFVIKFERGYSRIETAAAWFKAGTSCNQGVVPAPGCPIEDYCSFSQGFFFANGAVNNGASDFWINGLTIGGYDYSQAQGNDFWDIDRGRGGDQTMTAFFQLGALRLSGVESAMSSDVAIIDAYFAGLGIAVNEFITTGTQGNVTYNYFNLPETSGGYTKEDVIAAGGRIGTFIDANHCE